VPNQQLRTDLNFIVLASISGRLASFAQQIVLASVLVDEDYGIAAAALGVFSLTAVLRNGGGWMALGSLRSEEFETQGGPTFWACLFVCMLGAIITLISAPVASQHYANDAVGWVMVIYAAQLLASGFEQYSRAKIRAAMRLRALSILLSASSLVQCGASIGLAFGGAGVLALALPMLIGTVLDAVVCQSIAGLGPGAYRFRMSEVVSAFRALVPIFVLSVLTSINLGMDYLIASNLLGTAALGIYAFAYKIASQPYILLTMSLQRVLVSASLIASDHWQVRNRWLSGMATTVFFAVPAVCTAVALVFPWLENMIWNGKWQDANFLVVTLSLGLSGPVALGILVTPMLAERRYMVVLVTEGVRSASVIAGAFLGLLVIARLPVLGVGDLARARGMAIGVSLVTTVSSIGTALWLLRSAGLRVRSLFEALLSGPIVCFLAGFGAYNIGISLERSFELFSGRLGSLGIVSIVILMYALTLLLALQVLPSLHAPYRNILGSAVNLLQRWKLVSRD